MTISWTGNLSAKAAGTGLVLDGSEAQHSLSLEIVGGEVLARACRRGSPCNARGGKRFALAKTASLAKAKLETLQLEGKRQAALLTFPLRRGPGRWVLLLSASLEGTPLAVEETFSGRLDHWQGLQGERVRRVLLREKVGQAERLVFGSQYEHATVCGRPATIGAQGLDAKDMSWLPTSARSLSSAERAKAKRLKAEPSEQALKVDGPRLLEGATASSALGKSRSGLTDGDLSTRWAEARPGDGAGEFLVMRAAPEVAIEGLAFTMRLHAAHPPQNAAGPRQFFLATPNQLFSVTVPTADASTDAALSFRVRFPKALHTNCLALILAEPSRPSGPQEIGLVEVRALSAFDAVEIASLVPLLDQGSAKADAAKAWLMRGGRKAIRATIDGYETLGAGGKARALEVIEQGACSATAGFFTARLLGEGRDIAEFEPALDRIARRARSKLRQCPKDGAKELVRALAQARSERRRGWAANELATLLPAGAPASILAALRKRANETTKAGGNGLRQKLRLALSKVSRDPKARPAIASQLAPERFSELPLVVQIDFLRALGAELAEQPLAAQAFRTVLLKNRSFRTRYLLLKPGSFLARRGDTEAMQFVRRSLTDAKHWPIRARAADVSFELEALAGELEQALVDRAPRVRRAALASMARDEKRASKAQPRILELLRNDPWPFVRAAAAQGLTASPGNERSDEALIDALADPALLVRQAALRSLAKQRRTSAGEAILELANNAKEPLGIRKAAISALGALCHQPAAHLLFKLASRTARPQLAYDRPLGMAALAALAELKPAGLAEALAPLLVNDPRLSAHVRRIARDALQRPGSCGR